MEIINGLDLSVISVHTAVDRRIFYQADFFHEGPRGINPKRLESDHCLPTSVCFPICSADREGLESVTFDSTEAQYLFVKTCCLSEL